MDGAGEDVSESSLVDAIRSVCKADGLTERTNAQCSFILQHPKLMSSGLIGQHLNLSGHYAVILWALLLIFSRSDGEKSSNFIPGITNMWLYTPSNKRGVRKDLVSKWRDFPALVVVAPHIFAAKGDAEEAPNQTQLHFGGRQFIISPTVVLTHGSDNYHG